MIINSMIFAQGNSALVIEKEYTKEIDKLVKNKRVLKAFEAIDAMDGKSVEELIYLTEIPAPPFKEEQRAVAFSEMLRSAGADKVWIDEVGNVLALRKGTKGGRVVALDAHLDTVFPEGTDVKVKMKGDTLLAPGIGDDTRGLVVVLNVLKAMNEAEIKTEADILIIGSVGEEGLGDLRGVKHIFNTEDLSIDSWISVDGGSIGRITTSGLGSIRYKVTFKGPGGHSWGAFGLGNPHHALGYAIRNFDEVAAKFTSEGQRTSYNVGRIGGGTSVNSIPFESWMEVDMRSVSPESLKQIDKLFKESMNKGLDEYNNSIKEGPKLEMVLEVIGDRPSGQVENNVPLVQRTLASTKYFGAEPGLSSGSTNSNIPISKGIPSVTIGRGGEGGGAHSLDEWWLNDKGSEAVKLALLILCAESTVVK